MTFEIKRASIEKNQLFVSLRNDESVLRNGDELMVIDTDDLHPMGTFKVVEERKGECYAVGGKDVDQLWLGLMMERQDVSMVPYKSAILMERSIEQ